MPKSKLPTKTSLRAKRSNPVKIATPTSSVRNDRKAKTVGLSVPVYSLLGKETGTLNLPKEYFGQKVNKNLLSQALRVYMTNQKNFTASSKTRGEVQGTTKKMYAQKGTGRARHGAATAPIFVGGGRAFGPRPRVVRLSMPQKMRKAALIAALCQKAAEGKILALVGLEKATGKTKEFIQVLEKMNVKNGLILTGEKMDNVTRAVSNIQKIDATPANFTNAFEIIKHETLILTKEAVDKLEKNEASK